MNRLKLFLPLVAFVVVAAFFYVVLNRIDQGEYNPQDLPSALVNKPFPEFQMASLEDPSVQLSRADFLGDIVLINVWATWCISCRVEHPYLNKLAKQGLPIYGVNYKDDVAEARVWLKNLHDPYVLSVVDADGRLGIDLGVFGAPETYLVDQQGLIRYKHVGVVNERVWTTILKPIYDSLL